MACKCPRCSGGGSRVGPMLSGGDRVRPGLAIGCDAANPSGGKLFAVWAEEHVTAAGTDVDYWCQDLINSTLDPVYNEPEQRLWKGPYRIKAHVVWPEQQYEVREQGSRATFPSKIWIPRLAVEHASMADIPKEGDVVKFWQIPVFDHLSMGADQVRTIPGAGYYFDVISSVDTGHFLDAADFTGFELNLKRRTEFTPERRVMNQT